MLKTRSNKRELMDDLTLAEDALRQNLDELTVINHWLGGKHTLIDALNQVYKKYLSTIIGRKLVIADLGCGGGDLLRAIERWSKRKQLTVDLIGVDGNPFMIAYARQKANAIYQVADIFSSEFRQGDMDIICLNTFCHHLSDEDLIRLFKKLRHETKLAIIINDLRRNWFSYHAIKLITKLFRFSYLAQNDAPLSVLRSFTRQELIKLLQAANIEQYQIRKTWAFRWQVIMWCE